MRQNTVVGNTWNKEAYLIKDWLTSYSLLSPSMAIDQVVVWTQQGLVPYWRWGPVCFTNSRLTLEHTAFWGQLISKPHHCRHTSFHTSGGYLAVGLLVPSIVLSLTFWDADKLFSKMVVLSYIPLTFLSISLSTAIIIWLVTFIPLGMEFWLCILVVTVFYYWP